MREKRNIFWRIVGGILVLMGVATPGLSPWQLPACMVGGMLISGILDE
jgi:hypothetical protein